MYAGYIYINFITGILENLAIYAGYTLTLLQASNNNNDGPKRIVVTLMMMQNVDNDNNEA